jgi:hypothetical protein
MEEKKWKKKMATEERKAIAEEKGIALEEVKRLMSVLSY